MFFNTLFTAILLATATIAAPLIVFNPHIISPQAAVAWPMGSRQTVKWETDNIPKEMKNYNGTILLGHMENGSENLDVDHPLASQFPITSGSMAVRIPSNIPAGNDYFIVLLGDSGNMSPKFRIH